MFFFDLSTNKNRLFKLYFFKKVTIILKIDVITNNNLTLINNKAL